MPESFTHQQAEWPEPVFEEIEGCMEQDVGWMRVSAKHVMVGMYHNLLDPDARYTEYKRPWEVACED